ncbi:glutathione S-transferase [Formicincola oecophyllae]|uniref:Glutathione S-transferase n=1 Tax=Formicincola oecophyllae TaxID=2558361 RepID=A0A4Y6UCB1_9PROT|nr:glutathione S-transferase [Formicincola oecophyllae]QDH14087.1 glutathione S-transferase [Formicincola oecophyllae]
MKLIGTLDSPYVRRVAITLDLHDVGFKHEALSVFSTYDAFAAINPVVKAPTLVLDDGTVLMDSTLIIDYIEATSPPHRSLLPKTPTALAWSTRTLGLALAACEKTVQRVYELNLRPAEKRHQPWVERVTQQLLAACAGLEGQWANHPLPQKGERPSQAALTSAVAWSFMQLMLPDVVKVSAFPTLQALGAGLEGSAAFKRYRIPPS